MAAILGSDAETAGQQREVLEAIRTDRLTLPAGCEVTYEVATVDVLRALLRRPRSEQELEYFYREFEDRHGVRSTAAEVFHAGLDPKSNGDGSWLGFVERMGGLRKAEKAARAGARAGEFFRRLERTPMTKSYKVVLLLAMFEDEALSLSLPIADVACRVAAMARRVHRLAEDFAPE